MTYPLKTRQVCFFIIAFSIVVKIFSLPSIIANFAGEDMWISSLINLALDLVTLVVILFACKSADKDFLSLLQESFGVVGAKIIAGVYVVYFILKAVLPLHEHRNYIDFTLYTLNSTTFYSIPIFILAFYLCFKKFNVLGRLSDVLWLVAINGLITLIVLSFSNADFTAILPIGAWGAGNIFKGSFQSLAWFGDSVYIMFFIGNFKFEKKSFLKILGAFCLSAIMILAFMIIFYCVFTSIAYRQRFALTEIAKYTTVINDLGRFDYIGIIMLLFSSAFAVCLPVFFCAQLLNYIFNIKKTWIAPIIAVAVQVIFTLFFNKYFVSIQNFITNYVGYFFFVLCNIAPICISLKFIKEKHDATKTS